MSNLDWAVLLGTLLFIVFYGVWKTRYIDSSKGYLRGDDMPWWLIGLSIMATQASAITFLSTPGKAYDDGMGFVQFYFGLPLAMVILAAFVLPLYYKLRVYTAYEFLEKRFNAPTRTLTASIFLIQRGLAAGITIYAPAIILSSILGWNLNFTNLLIGVLVIIYTVAGGTKAVSQTQKQQMIVIMVGMIVAFTSIIYLFPEEVSFGDAVWAAGQMDHMEVINWEFNLTNRYTIWSGMLGGTFLFLSYFGTDQSQVQRYLGGRSLNQSRLGLMFNGLFKIPMQFFILFVGVMVFIFFQFERPPLHFNPANVDVVQSEQADGDRLEQINQKYATVFEEKREKLLYLIENREQSSPAAQEATRLEVMELYNEEQNIRKEADDLIIETNAEAETKDSDYVFITFVLNYLPIGLIGLLLAVIFSAAMSSTASELNALSTTTVIDLYKQYWKADASDMHYLTASKIFTVFWGMVALLFATYASLFENLIEAVNIIGSIFYGSVLGVFVVAFFMKFIQGRAVFWGTVLSQIIVILVYFFVADFAFLWLNALGCLLVMATSTLLQWVYNFK
ncbi:MAG: sodium:solute symporter [Bacteroidetes bacterium]|jgi:SSS family transporter|nr:sodium:solute symporter [Bacteroidota bacterium]